MHAGNKSSVDLVYWSTYLLEGRLVIYGPRFYCVRIESGPGFPRPSDAQLVRAALTPARPLGCIERAAASMQLHTAALQMQGSIMHLIVNLSPPPPPPPRGLCRWVGASTPWKS